MTADLFPTIAILVGVSALAVVIVIVAMLAGRSGKQ